MSFRSQLKLDFNKLANNPKLTHFTQQLNGYENRVASFVKDFDIKSREARERSRHQLDKFLRQIKRTRSEVEKKVATLVNQEGKKLNKRINELFSYLKTLAQKEKAKAEGKARGSKARKSNAKSQGSRSRSKSGTTRTRSKSTP